MGGQAFLLLTFPAASREYCRAKEPSDPPSGFGACRSEAHSTRCISTYNRLPGERRHRSFSTATVGQKQLDPPLPLLSSSSSYQPKGSSKNKERFDSQKFAEKLFSASSGRAVRQDLIEKVINRGLRKDSPLTISSRLSR
jgi:hypothetical protein